MSFEMKKGANNEDYKNFGDNWIAGYSGDLLRATLGLRFNQIHQG